MARRCLKRRRELKVRYYTQAGQERGTQHDAQESLRRAQDQLSGGNVVHRNGEATHFIRPTHHDPQSVGI